MKPIHIHTPLIESTVLAEGFGAPVWLKMEALQPVGSFKLRGVGLACQESKQAGFDRIVCSSGGNAGYAVAYAGRQLDLPVDVYVPTSTPELMLELIRKEGAQVHVYGESWDDTHTYASELARTEGAAYIHPFDDPRLWRGHASLVHEVAEAGVKPGAVVLSVGGGGLMLGVIEGLRAVGWGDVPVLAVETEGADSFARSSAAGELITLERISSIATSLGAKRVAAETLTWSRKHRVIPWVVSDRQAVDACLRFADDHRLLVEPACGAALSAIYNRAPAIAGQAVLVIVCGGAGVNRNLLARWDREVE